MIRLTFVAGGNMRKVFIDNRQVSMLTSETGFKPLEIDLDKLDQPEYKARMERMKLAEEDLKEMKKLSKLGTEEEIGQDIIKDFQKTGWRCVKKECLG